MTPPPTAPIQARWSPPLWGLLITSHLSLLCSGLLWLLRVGVQAVLRTCYAVVLPEGLVQLIHFGHQGQTDVQVHL